MTKPRPYGIGGAGRAFAASVSRLADAMNFAGAAIGHGPRYYVQGETIRGEPRVYWVVDRTEGDRTVSPYTRDRRQAERWCQKRNAATEDKL